MKPIATLLFDMKINSQEIERLAKLSKIELSQEEKQKFPGELSAILEYVELLNEVNTDEVEETSQVTGLTNVTREDDDNYTFEKSDMIASMPDTNEEGELKVHAVFTGDSPSH